MMDLSSLVARRVSSRGASSLGSLGTVPLSRGSRRTTVNPMAALGRFAGRGLSCSKLSQRPGLPAAIPAASRSRKRSVAVQALFEKFTERSIKAIMIAQAEARAFGSAEVSTEHVLLGLIAEDSLSKHGYLNSGLTFEAAKTAVESLTGRRRPLSSNDAIPFSASVRKNFELATNECKRSGVNWISPEHILLAMLSLPDSNGRKVVDSLGLDREALKAEASKRLKGDGESEQSKKKKASEKDGPKMLEEYCRDLIAEVRSGRIDPVIGREREVARVCQILARRTKNNPILLGEPGVGKTAIAEGLALAIVQRACTDGTPLPEFLLDKRVMQLDVGLLIAGAKERGELESRVTKLIAEIKESGNVILMIDEVHTLVGAGSVGRGGSGGLDISNLIKPALARGEFQVIGATTIDEHRKYIERDAALERRFQPVMIGEPTPGETLQILMGLKERYERHHRCAYSEEALQAAVTLSTKYIADRFLPDKAIDLIDEAGSRARISAYNARRAMRRVEHPKLREYLQVLETKDEAVKDGLFEEAVILRRREVDYRAELAGPPCDGSTLPVVGVAEIEHIVSTWTGIPVERMDQDEQLRLLQLGSILQEHVIGQEDAVASLAAALCRSRSGLKDPRRPTASLLFVGPTGVGKTELAKVLAEQYFGSRESMIRLDMSEYMERHSVSKLVGAPPGYVGYGEGGKLTEAVRRRPCSIVLFDEIEKAHPDVFSILLQILEDGRLTDSQGRTVSFKNALIILTSNVGSRTIAGTSSLSSLSVFGSGAKAGRTVPEDMSAAQIARMKEVVLSEVKAQFRPELLNRFDETIVFQRLGRREVRAIAGLMLAETRARVAARGYTLVVTPALVEKIVADGHSDEYGVRPLRQTLVRYIDDVLSEAMLNRKFPQGTTITMGLDRAGEPAVLDDSAAALQAGSGSGEQQPALQNNIVVLNPAGVDGAIRVSSDGSGGSGNASDDSGDGPLPNGGSGSRQVVTVHSTMDVDHE